MPTPLKVVVLTTAKVGVAVALSLAELDGVGGVTLVTAPVRPKRRGLFAKLHSIYHFRGPRGLVAAAGQRIRRPRRASLGIQLREHVAHAAPHIAHHHVDDICGSACRAALAAIAPDLGVVVATPILPPSIFALPPLGSVNLHFGKAPDYRGSSPGFWEMMDGVREVGVTIHHVTERLDGGDILLQECFPLDPAPDGDPLEYLAHYRNAVLVPPGVRMMRDAVARLASGTAIATRQEEPRGRTFRRASYTEQRELQRRVAERRRLANGS